MSFNIDRGSTEKYIDDAAITTKIKARFAADDLVNATDINVKTEDLKVFLKGEVNDQFAIDRAVEIAKNTAGVKEVIQELKVKH